MFKVAGSMGQAAADVGQPLAARQLLTLAIDVGRDSDLPGVSDLEQALAALGPAENDANE